jgi:hypothetical protein
MIATPQYLPLVRWQNKRNVPLSEGWLAETIDRSALRAGYEQWSWTPELLKALVYYLRKEFQGTLIGSMELQNLIRDSLLHIGYANVADKLVLTAPRAVIYLPELARQSGFELMFFQKLNDYLEEIAWLAIGGIKLEGLREAVKILHRTGRWRHDCSGLSEDIVAFTRCKLAHRHNDDIELVII